MYSFLPPGLSEGEPKTATPRDPQQGSDALRRHPAALVPMLPYKDALPEQERRSPAHTGIQAERAAFSQWQSGF